MKIFFVRIVTKIYLSLFSFKRLKKFNVFLNNLTLRVMGFNNCCDMKKSGELYFIKRYLNNAKLCIDIGANRGEYALALLENTQSFVISYEPQNSCNVHLEKLVKNYPDRFSYHNILLSDNFKKVKFYYGSDCGGLSTASSKSNDIDYVNKRNINSKILETVTLDSNLDKIKKIGNHLDLLKIDVEGLERNILLGANNVLKELKPRFIQIEFNLHQLYNENTMISFSNILQDYDLYRLLSFSKGMTKVESHSPLSNLYYYSNYVFVHKNENIN